MIDAGFSFAAALTLGLLGSVHCAAMCGGLAAAFTLAVPKDATPFGRACMLASLSAGRLLGYALAGALAGALGVTLATLLGASGAATLRLVAGLVLLVIALTIAGLGSGTFAFERVGMRVWRHVQPLAVALQRDLRGGRALALGFVWGWLPCGLVYGALGFAATTGGALPAAFAMVGFGLGTLPGVLLPSVAAFRLGRVTHATSSRRVAAVMLAAFALWTLVGGATMLQAARNGGSCHDTASVAHPRADLDATTTRPN